VLRSRCAEVHAAPVTRSGRIVRTFFGTRPGEPLSLAWFHEPGLARWVRTGLGARRYEAVLVYSSAMAAYVPPGPGWPLRILDMVDVDSEKWRAYAASAGGPKRLVWAREARTLLAFERRAAAQFDRTLLVSAQEAQTFATLAPEAASRIDWVENGVDVARFDRDETAQHFFRFHERTIRRRHLSVAHAHRGRFVRQHERLACQPVTARGEFAVVRSGLCQDRIRLGALSEHRLGIEID